ncbi:ATP-grasp domain-containing protein [Serinibacter salmoneus]|uniref:ATP-grasp domain-containing protein n=1 Tax=Serinibacter salmoneus TaxID=556530 RepID=A0A2A9D467_9MICO|nr:ATP-grasp domain-containing protein [Serinibacter salmoneus]PFG21181.1 ATP-grasp domain-containing protein [Serinibacter salmoneus]
MTITAPTRPDTLADPARVPTVVVTGAKGPAGRALARQFEVLRAAGLALRTVGADMLPGADPAWDSTAVLPAVHDAEYLASLRRLLERVEADLLIPTVAEELPILAQTGQSLAPDSSCAVVLSGAGPSAACADKLLTMWALDAAGVSIPRYRAITVGDDAAGLIAWAEGPVVVKPRVSRGGRGVHLVEHRDDPVHTAGSWIAQSFAPGTEYCPQVYRSPHTGEVRVVVVEKTELKQGRVGNAAHARRLPEGEAVDVAWLAECAVTALDLVGPVDLDIRRDEQGVPVVLEVNARFGANSHLAPELLHAVLRDWDLTSAVARPGATGVHA